MTRLGVSANGFAAPARLEAHAIFEWDARAAVYVEAERRRRAFLDGDA
jgi:hypothetical protein